MNRKTMISLLVFAVLGVGAVVALRAPEKGERRGPHERPKGQLSFRAPEVDALEVTSGKDKTTLKKENGHWVVAAPVHYPADEAAVKSAVDKLAEMTFGDVVSEQKEKAKDMEVDEEKGTHVVARQGTRVLCDLYFGKTVSGTAMARPAGSDQIWQAQGVQKFSFARDTKGWRDKVITDFRRDDIETVAIEAAGKGKVVVKRLAGDKAKGTPEKLQIAESSLKIDKLDEALAQGVVSGIYSLRAIDFADGVAPAESGLAKPDYTITTRAGGKTFTVLVGKAKADNYYVKTADAPQVFLVPKYTVERIAKPPVDFRDKTLTDLKPDELASIEITYAGSTVELEKAGADWKAKRPAITADPAKVAPIAAAFGSFKAFAFAPATDAKTTGLGKPTGKITVRTKDKKSVTIVVGALKDNADYFVQVQGRPEVYLCKKFAIDRFLKKPDDLKKTDAQTKKS